MNEPLERYYDQGHLVAMVLRGDTSLGQGVHFLTSPELPLQLGYMNHPQGKVVPAHVHNEAVRQVANTSEVLIIRSGRLEVDLLHADGSPLASFELGAGDIIFLCGGAHGFKALTPLEMVEVKQGPYLGENDKRLLDQDQR